MLGKTLFMTGMMAFMAGALLTTVSRASAHEVREVADGQYQMVVGFSTEPAFVNDRNGLDLYVYSLPPGGDFETTPEEDLIGVEGLEETLEAEIIQGESTMPLEIEGRFAAPGEYDGWVYPTVVGDYTFHIFGTINGTEIDETFDSGPETFSPIGDTAALEFPEQVPSNQELAAQIEAVEGSSDSDNSDTAMVVGVIGIVLGALGLAAGGFALVRSRS
jgi:hypothetical protein